MYSKNIILDTDSYKASHWLQYPAGTTNVYSYVESRGGKYPYTVFVGLQPLLRKLEASFITETNVVTARDFFTRHGLPFNYDGWMHIVNNHGGRLPLIIKAVPEGSVVPTGNVLMTIENTDPACFWLTSWLETYLMRVWYPITVATQSRTIKELIYSYLKTTADDADSEINFKLHDFGSRGVSSAESAALGGMAHLVNFMGSDTVLGVELANRFYKCDMAAFSIPAAEHSTITAYGQEHEVDAYRNMLDQFAKPGSLVAVVSDSYDLDNAVRNLWGGALKDQVIASGATVVIRPDSGDPAKMVLQTLQGLDATFGSTVNTKGYKVLNNVRVIQGDGINEDSIKEILNLAMEFGFSASNIAFGMGGALLQQVNRDTQRFAYKCSSIIVNGEERDVFKCPKDEPYKKSKAGRFHLIGDGGNWKTVRIGSDAPYQTSYYEAFDRLYTVFENGYCVKEYTFDEVRSKAKL